MSEMEKIERLAGQYADAHSYLAMQIAELQRDIAQVKRARIEAIKRAVRAAAGCKDKLKAGIEANRGLFVKPKTRVLAGIKIGYRKLKGEVVIGDEAATIKRIRTLLPREQAELLIRVREAVDRNAVADLSVADLKRLGIAIEDDSDVVVIRPTDSDVDKLVEALLAEDEHMEAA